MHPEWLTALRDQCLEGGIKFLFKQWGNWRPVAPRDVNGYRSKTVFLSNGNGIILANVGKKAAGRTLQGRTWDEFPKAPASA
jgi:protein gp37